MMRQADIAPTAGTTSKRAERPTWMRIFQSKTATVGLFLIVVWVLAALLAPILPLPSPIDSDVTAMGDPTPSLAHWLGTDILGRDILARLIFGARTVLIVAPLSVAVAMVVGIAMGMVAGYYGGWIDTLVSRFSDIILAFLGTGSLRHPDRQYRPVGHQYRDRHDDRLGPRHRPHYPWSGAQPEATGIYLCR